MAIIVRSFAGLRAFHEAIAALLAAELGRECDVPHAVMLAGGQTPQPAYDLVARTPVPVSPRAHVLFSDERMVPADSQESNYGRAFPMLSSLGMHDDRVLRVRTEASLEAAAERYHADIAAFLASGGRITLALLGIGTDGHTASLFNVADVVRGPDHWAIPVARHPGPARVSVTGALIRRAERPVFLAAGSGKHAILDIFLNDPGRIPAGRVALEGGRAELWRV